MKKYLFLVTCIFLVVFVFPQKKRKNADNLPLIGTKWVVTHINQELVKQTQDTAFVVFDAEYHYHGNLGCNMFFGNYTAGKKRLRLDFEGSTRKMCVGENLENRFSYALKNEVKNYYIEKNALILWDKSQPVLQFIGTQKP